MKTKVVPADEIDPAKGLRASDYIEGGARSLNHAAVMKGRAAKRSMIEALHYLGKMRCKRSNCGTACLCAPCHARKALEHYDPTWRPR